MIKVTLLFIFLFFFSCTKGSDENELNLFKQIDTSEIFDLYQEAEEIVFVNEWYNDFLIGNIQDMKFGGDGIFLVDEEIPAIYHLSWEESRKKVGRSGRGPGEYGRPVTIELYNNELYVLDRRLSRITNYKKEKDSGEFTVEKSGTIDMNISDFCIINGEMWIYSRHGADIIHKLNSDLDTLVSSTGEGIDIEDPVIREISRDGLIGCDGQFIYAGFVNDKKIKIYDRISGKLHNQIVFDEINPVIVSPVNQNGREAYSRLFFQGEAYDERGGYHDNLVNMIIIDGFLLAQYERFFKDEEESFVITLSLDLNQNTYARTESLPIIYDYQENEGFLTEGSSSEPYIKIRRRVYN